MTWPTKPGALRKLARDYHDQADDLRDRTPFIEDEDLPAHMEDIAFYRELAAEAYSRPPSTAASIAPPVCVMRSGDSGPFCHYAGNPLHHFDLLSRHHAAPVLDGHIYPVRQLCYFFSNHGYGR
jgi:hypothetical protein